MEAQNTKSVQEAIKASTAHAEAQSEKKRGADEQTNDGERPTRISTTPRGEKKEADKDQTSERGKCQENLKTSLAPILVFAPLLKDTLESMDDFEQLKLRVEHYRQMLKKIELDLPRTRAVGSRYLVQLSRLKSSLRSKVLMFIDLLLVQFNNNFKSAATT